MNKKVLLSASVAIAAYALGVTGFTLAVSTHVWHILGIPTYIVTAASFVVANLVLTALLGKKNEYTNIMIMQGLLLGIAFSSIRLFVPVCALMTNAMLVASFGMMALGCILKLALSLPRTRALPY